MNTGDWTAIGAIATGVMAIATFILALKTRSMAKATEKMVCETSNVAKATLQEARAVEQQTGHIEQQVKISSDALRSSVQPWLVWIPSYQDVGPENVLSQKLGALFFLTPLLTNTAMTSSVVSKFETLAPALRLSISRRVP